MDLTVLELHFPNAEFNAPYANTTDSPDDAPTQSADEQSESGIFPLLFLLIIAGIATIAYLLRNRTATAE